MARRAAMPAAPFVIHVLNAIMRSRMVHYHSISMAIRHLLHTNMLIGRYENSCKRTLQRG